MMTLVRPVWAVEPWALSLCYCVCVCVCPSDWLDSNEMWNVIQLPAMCHVYLPASHAAGAGRNQLKGANRRHRDRANVPIEFNLLNAFWQISKLTGGTLDCTTKTKWLVAHSVCAFLSLFLLVSLPLWTTKDLTKSVARMCVLRMWLKAFPTTNDMSWSVKPKSERKREREKAETNQSVAHDFDLSPNYPQVSFVLYSFGNVSFKYMSSSKLGLRRILYAWSSSKFQTSLTESFKL